MTTTRQPLHVTVDTHRCIGSGECVIACPEVFDQSDDGIVVILDTTPTPALTEKVQDAVRACPADVIRAEAR